jgi:hypothetical protein
MRKRLLALAAAVCLAACSSSVSVDDDADILATIPGTWEAAVLGGTLRMTLSVGAVDPETHQAPLTGNGSFVGSQFDVAGTLGGKTVSGRDELGIVKLQWTMPYQGSARNFTFGGGLAGIANSTFAQLNGTLTPEGAAGISLILEKR